MIHKHERRRLVAYERSFYSTSGPVSTRMDDRLRAGTPFRYLTNRLASIPGSPNRVPDYFGYDKGGNVTSVGWQVTVRDPVRHVSSSSGEASCELLCTRFGLHCLCVTTASAYVEQLDVLLSCENQRCGVGRL